MKLLSSKKDLNTALNEVIEQSKNKLTIISPFISFRDNNLNEKIKNKKKILEIYTKLDGKNKEEEDMLIVLKKLVDNEDNLLLIDFLHAKIYINDETALLTSMNFNDDAYKKSLDFGIITETKEEYNNVIKHCDENIFIYNKKYIIDFLPEKSIGVKFEKDRNSIAKCDDRVNYLKLEKDKDTNIRCSVEKAYKMESNEVFILEITKNGKNYQLENNKYGTFREGKYFIPLSIDQDDVQLLYQKEQPLLIPVLNKYKDKTLKILLDVYNCLNE
jgi:phosphatidylserine/phosphatidylglycerophosphate/cardiolipin synthase-like enzyme